MAGIVGRRLDVKPQKKLRGAARYLRAAHQGFDQLAQWYPAYPGAGVNYIKYALPVYEKLICEERSTQALRAEVFARYMSVLPHVATNRPPGERSGVIALFDWPNFFWGEVTIFYTAPYAEPFTTRAYAEAPSPTRDPFAETVVAVPDGFTAAGMRWSYFDDEDDTTYFGERWTVTEDAMPAASLPDWDVP